MSEINSELDIKGEGYHKMIALYNSACISKATKNKYVTTKIDKIKFTQKFVLIEWYHRCIADTFC